MRHGCIFADKKYLSLTFSEKSDISTIQQIHSVIERALPIFFILFVLFLLASMLPLRKAFGFRTQLKSCKSDTNHSDPQFSCIL